MARRRGRGKAMECGEVRLHGRRGGRRIHRSRSCIGIRRGWIIIARRRGPQWRRPNLDGGEERFVHRHARPCTRGRSHRAPAHTRTASFSALRLILCGRGGSIARGRKLWGVGHHRHGRNDRLVLLLLLLLLRLWLQQFLLLLCHSFSHDHWVRLKWVVRRIQVQTKRVGLCCLARSMRASRL